MNMCINICIGIHAYVCVSTYVCIDTYIFLIFCLNVKVLHVYHNILLHLLFSLSTS